MKHHSYISSLQLLLAVQSMLKSVRHHSSTSRLISVSKTRDGFLKRSNEFLQEFLFGWRHHVEEAPVLINQPLLLESLHHDVPGHQPPLEAVHEEHRPARDVLRRQPDLVEQELGVPAQPLLGRDKDPRCLADGQVQFLL
uniref:Uncharacterized protein n=1 Tax=Arundo donax TaxID=35708 RepID=A0A0A9FXC2_ARUDO